MNVPLTIVTGVLALAICVLLLRRELRKKKRGGQP